MSLKYMMIFGLLIAGMFVTTIHASEQIVAAAIEARAGSEPSEQMKKSNPRCELISLLSLSHMVWTQASGVKN